MERIPVSTHSEWDPLKVVVLGIATGAQVPTVKDRALHCVDYGALDDEGFALVPTGPYPARVVEETEEDLEVFSDALRKAGVRVLRPTALDMTQRLETPLWSVDGYHLYCPRDCILTIGSTAIETPMAMRHRQNEARAYRELIDTVRAPVPALPDSMYDRRVLGVPTLRDDEPAFDAANVLKMGRDLLYLVSNTGNVAGARWLQEFLGDKYRVHLLRDVYAFQHVDSTVLPLRPGLVLVCPARIREGRLPEFFRGWDRIYAPDPVETECDQAWGPASKWLALNCLSLSPELIVVEARQTGLMRTLERHGIDVLPVQMRHARTLGGGPHCVTLDLVREGTLEDYA